MFDLKNTNGLECCKSDNCNICPYSIDEWTCNKAELKSCTLSLLKSMEPRVMTLDEIIAAVPGTVVWLEDYDKTDVIAGLVRKVYIYTKVIDFLIVKEEANDEVTADFDDYGKRWRCWTSHPTDAQREAAQWI